MRARCRGARAEQRLARLDAAHVEVHVVLPRVADAAVDLDALLGEQALAVAGRGLGDRRRARAARVVLGDRERGEVAESSGPARAAIIMSANLCLIAWNEPIGTPNCSRCFAYSSVVSKIVCAVPTISSASATVASSSARRSARCGRRVGIAEHAVARRRARRRGRRARAAAAVERVHRRGADVGDRNDDARARRRRPVLPGDARDHHELVDRVAFDDEALLARRAPRRRRRT